jgi:type I restriction enzyme, S subunit
MALTLFADVVTLSTTRTADPLAAGIERFVGLEHIEPENLHIRSWGNVADGTTFTNTFKRGQVLFGKRRAYQRKVAVADFDGICSSDIYVFESKDPNVLLPELLPFICQSEGFYQYAVKTSAGSLSPRTNWSHLANYEFSLPPMDEQRRIADLLWAADDAIQGYKTTWEKAENLRLALINDELCKFTEFVEMKALCSKIIDGPHYPPKFTEKGIPFLLISNLSSGAIDWSVKKWISEKSYEEIYPRINTEVGDVLYTVVGSFGVPVYVDWDKPFGFQRHIALLKPNRNLLDGYFLKYYLESNLGKHQANLRAVGLAQKTITLGALQKYKLPQLPIEQQRQIVEKVRKAELSTKLLEDHIANTEQVKQSLLNKMLQ